MQLHTMATDSVKDLYRNSAPPTLISVGVMKPYSYELHRDYNFVHKTQRNRKGKPVRDEESREQDKITALNYALYQTNAIQAASAV